MNRENYEVTDALESLSPKFKLVTPTQYPKLKTTFTPSLLSGVISIDSNSYTRIARLEIENIDTEIKQEDLAVYIVEKGKKGMKYGTIESINNIAQKYIDIGLGHLKLDAEYEIYVRHITLGYLVVPVSGNNF